MKVEGKVVLITGGTGGMGKAFAEALLGGKASVVCLVDIAKNGNEVAAELKKEYSESTVQFSHCDVTDYYKFKAVFDKLYKDNGRIDIVCNCAGFLSDDHHVENCQRSFRVNLEAVYWGTNLATEYMDKRSKGNGGVVVNIASTAGLAPYGECIVYAATKHGVVALSRSAALNYDLTGIKVCTLCPGPTETALLDVLPGFREAVPKEEIMMPDFVAKALMQLVEDENSNGAVMKVTSQDGTTFVDYPPQMQGSSFRLVDPKVITDASGL